MDGKTSIGLNSNHVRINKFTSEQDHNYKLVLVEIQRMVAKVEKVLAGLSDTCF